MIALWKRMVREVDNCNKYKESNVNVQCTMDDAMKDLLRMKVLMMGNICDGEFSVVGPDVRRIYVPLNF